MKEKTEKERAEFRVKESKRYVLISQIALRVTSALGMIAIIVSFFKLNSQLLTFGWMLIFLSLVWLLLESKWKDQVKAWQHQLNKITSIYMERNANEETWIINRVDSMTNRQVPIIDILECNESAKDKDSLIRILRTSLRHLSAERKKEKA